MLLTVWLWRVNEKINYYKIGGFMKYISLVGILTGCAMASFSIAKDSAPEKMPTFYLKNNSNWYMQFNFVKKNGGDFYTTFKKIAPNDSLKINDDLTMVDGMTIKYCDSKVDCLAKNLLAYNVRFVPSSDSKRTYYLKFDVNDNKPSLKAQKGTGIWRHTNDEFKYSLRHNIKDRDIVSY